MSDKAELVQEILATQKDLANKQAKLKQLENKAAVRPIEDYTEQDKIDLFNQIHAHAISVVEDHKRDDYHEDNDEEHWCYELVMGILAPAGNKQAFWDYFNSLYEN